MVKLNGTDVGHTGYGLMNFTWRPDVLPDEQVFEALNTALANGATFWNGGEFYGKVAGPNSLTLLNRYFSKYPENASKVTLSIKGGLTPAMKPDSSPEGLRRSIENCLSQLPPSVKKIDIFEPARKDPAHPVEEVVKNIGEYVKQGKLGGVGLSEVNKETLEKAHAAFPISAVEVELSLWETTFLENGLVDTAVKLGVPVVGYSPLGRGFLSGQIKSRSDLKEGDIRLHYPRFSEENFPKNIELADKLGQFAEKKGCSPAQLALAWVRALNRKQGAGYIIPIPGGTTAQKVKDNSADTQLTAQEEEEVNELVKSMGTAGSRAPPMVLAGMAA